MNPIVRNLSLFLTIFTTILSGLAVTATIASAATLTVTTTADSVTGSLRAQITAASSGDTITFADTIDSDTPITLTNGSIVIDKDLTILGTEEGVIIQGNGSERVFEVQDGYTVSISRVTITGGSASGDGGGIYIPGGTLYLAYSTISGNTATGNGGGIANNTGTLETYKSTISGNTATSAGGGIYSVDGTVTMESLTITNNTCGSGGCGLDDNTILTISDTIIAGNNVASGTDVKLDNTPTSNDTNLIGTDVNNYFTAGEYLGSDSLLLGSLADNGGPTKTHMPQWGSPAIDAGSVTGIAIVDQRGIGRPIDGNDDSSADPDIGAVEANPVDLYVTKTADSSTAEPGDSLTYTIVVSNNGPNDVCEAVDFTDTMPESLTNVNWTCTPSSGTVCSNDSGTGDIDEIVETLPAGQTLTYAVTGTVASSASGTISNTADITTTYDLDTDTSNNSATATTTVDSGANSAPVASNQIVVTAAYNSMDITLSATDADGDSLTYSIVAQPQNGTLTGTAPNVTYTPNPGYTGSDSFTFKANDGQADSNTATVTISVTPGVNTAPAAGAQIIWVTGSTTADYSVTLSGTDWDGDNLTYQIVSEEGIFTSGTAPGITCRFYGDDTSGIVIFRVYDGEVYSAPATVSFKRSYDAAVNSPAVAHAQVVRTSENTSVPITLAASDWEGNDIIYKLVTDPQHGTLTGTPPDVIYTPETDYTGSDFFKFRAYTTRKVYSSPAVVNIEIGESENMAPVADAGSDQDKIKTEEGIMLDGSASSDPDGSIVSYEWSEGGTIFTSTAEAYIDSGYEDRVDRYFTLAVTDDNGMTSYDTVLCGNPGLQSVDHPGAAGLLRPAGPVGLPQKGRALRRPDGHPGPVPAVYSSRGPGPDHL